MKTNNNRKIYTILYSLLVLALLVPMLACGDSDNKQTVNRPVPNDTLTEEKPKETPSTPTDPLEAIYGSWEVNYGGKQGYEKWNFKRATNKDGDYVGKVTDANNDDIYNYTIKPQPNNPSSGTIGLVGLTQMNLVGQGKTLDYEVSDNGNKITLKDNPEIVLKRDSGNADIQAFADKISNLSPWKLNSAAASAMGLTGDTTVDFNPPEKYSTGYGGKMIFTDITGKTEERIYTITSKNEVTLKDGTGEKLATYKLESDDLLVIKYKDEPGVLSLTH